MHVNTITGVTLALASMREFSHFKNTNVKFQISMRYIGRLLKIHSMKVEFLLKETTVLYKVGLSITVSLKKSKLQLYLHDLIRPPIDHREDYRSCTWPFYSLVRTFPKALHSD